MADDDLMELLWPDNDLTPEQRTKFTAGITPERRATFERLAFVADELNAGRVPAGVIVCREHSK